MREQSTVPERVVEEFLGDVALLVERIGSAEGLIALRGAAFGKMHRVRDLPSLRGFLRDYQRRILIPLELPAVCTCLIALACA